MIVVSPIFFRSNKSLSPVNKKSAFPSTDKDNKKLSLGSRHIFISDRTSIKSAYSPIVSNISSMSVFEKKHLNFGRLATSKNSSSNSWLKTKMLCLEKIISSSFVKSFVIKKLIQRLVSIIILSTLFRISFASYSFYFLGYFVKRWC